jgi:hypothetical protein
LDPFPIWDLLLNLLVQDVPRLLSRESARLRKQQHVDKLVQEVARLQADNARVAARTADIASHYTRMDQENTVLRGRTAELGDRLRSVNEVLRVVEEFSGVAMDIQEEMPADDPLLRPWQLPYPAAAMPIGGGHMLQYSPSAIMERSGGWHWQEELVACTCLAALRITAAAVLNLCSCCFNNSCCCSSVSCKRLCSSLCPFHPLFDLCYVHFKYSKKE